MSDLTIARTSSSAVAVPNASSPSAKWQGHTVQSTFPLEKESRVALWLLRQLHAESPSLLTRDVLSVITEEFDEQALEELYANAERLFGDEVKWQIVLCRAWYKKAWDWSKEKAKRGCKELKKGFDETEKFARKKVVHGTEKFFKKDVSHFVKEHKTECIIAGVVVAAILCRELIGVCLAALAARRLFEEMAKQEETEKNHEREKSSHEPPPPPNPFASFLEQMERVEIPESFYKTYKPTIPLPSIEDPAIAAHEEEINALKASVEHSLKELRTQPGFKDTQMHFLKETRHLQGHAESAIARFMHSLAAPVEAPSISYANQIRPVQTNRSCYMQTTGNKRSDLGIGFINGMKNDIVQAHSNMLHIKKLAGEDICIEGVYNNQHDIVSSLGEVFLANYQGFAPNTAELLQTNWQRFHQANLDNPKKKYLQFTHSQGTILTRNALNACPPEIQKRVIIVSFGVAAVVDKEICFKSFPYRSEKDIVHYGEDIYTHCIASFIESEEDRKELLDTLVRHKAMIKVLPAHAGATGIDHDFQSPTNFDEILNHIKDYLKKQGEYTD
jgi:hypothetical protein